MTKSIGDFTHFVPLSADRVFWAILPVMQAVVGDSANRFGARRRMKNAALKT